MTLNEYAKVVMPLRTKKATLTYALFKLGGEAGEVLEKFGKQLRDADGDYTDETFRGSVVRELGDVLWYVTAIAEDMGVTLEDVAERNINKLLDRSERGVIGGSGDYR
jgi:NTP pyrophosphatase (non-canonical NTP hydrolase)